MATTDISADDTDGGVGHSSNDSSTSHQPANHAPLKGGQLVLGTIAVSLATFMEVLDSSIANVSIAAISGDFGASMSQGTWVITSYAVSTAVGVPLTGWLCDRFGTVRLFTSIILLFSLFSLLCGFAPSLGWLIFFRVMQGLVAGPMIPLSQALLLQSYPKEKSGLALAMWSITVLIAPLLGPLLGGWITDNHSWPWIFYINVPVGILAAAITWELYQDRESVIRKLPIDAVGLVLLVVWVGAMQIMLDKGKELDWFESTQIIALACVAVIGFVFFIAWELTEKHPVVDMTLFKNRNFVISTLVLSCGFGLFFGNLILLPLWLQQYMGYTATMAGFVLAPVGIFALLLSPMVGKNVHRVDPRIFTTISFFTFALLLWMRSLTTTDSDMFFIIIPTIIQGIAVSCFFIPLVSLTLSGVSPDKIAAASGLSNFVRITVGAFAASLATTLWEHRETVHHARLAEQMNYANPAFTNTMAAMQAEGMEQGQVMGYFNRLIDNQAAIMGVNELFYASALAFLALLALVWLSRPVKGGGPGMEAGGGH